MGGEGLADVYEAAAELGVDVELVGDAVATVADGGVVLASEDLAYGGQSKLGLFAEEIHGDLPGLGGLLVAFAAFDGFDGYAEVC